MTNRVKLATLVWCIASSMFAQQPTTSANPKTVTDDDNADFTFTESQLDEDNESAQTVSALVATKSDPYLSEVGFLFSPMRFRVRGLDNRYTQTYLNGIMFNDAERGQFSYAMIGGLNDVTRGREGASPFETTTFGLTGIGGASSINMRASQQQQGNKLTLSGCNRNYVARAIYTHSTGFNANGWAFATSIGYRWANEGVIEGTFYNSLSYYLAAEKKLGDRNTLSLITFGSPTERGQQQASTEEAYWLANSHYYNPNWGYQNGKKRNSRVVNDFEPTAILTWDFDINQDTKLSTSAGFRYSMYSSTALGWNGNAYDPRPDYYKNFPSSIFDVYDEKKNNGDYLGENKYFLDQWNTLYDYWTSDKANRQVQWDRMYAINREEAARGGEALYYQERRHNDQMVLAINSTFNRNINLNNKYSLGLQLNSTKGMHYKTMADLLGAVNYYDYDKFAANDNGRNSDAAQNDLRYPNKRIGEGDRFGYDYNIYVHKARLWGQYLYNYGKWNFDLGGHLDGTTFEREGKMQNGRAKDHSYGESGWAYFLHGGGKARLAFSPTPNHRISLGGGWDNEAPLPNNSFVAPRIQNNFIDNLRREDIYNAELAYDFAIGPLAGRVAGFFTQFKNGTEQTAFYNDGMSTFTYISMTGIEKQHYGVEAALKLRVTNNLSFQFIGSIAEGKYTNNPDAQLYSESFDKLSQPENPVTGAVMNDFVVADGMRVSGTPLTAASIGVNYNVSGWFFELNLNYYDRVYVGFSPYNRLASTFAQQYKYGKGGFYTSQQATDAAGNQIMQYMVTKAELNENGGLLFNGETGQLEYSYAREQEKFKGGFMLDASIGRFLRLKHGRTLSINLSLSNILNNTNLRTGGYEQSRDDSYFNSSQSTDVNRYKFSKNSKYYYANAFNAFLNIGYRF